MSKQKIRARTRDVAFPYRMGAGFPGTVNRTHPASIVPRKINTSTPPLAYGMGVLVTANSVRQIAAGDTAVTRLYGIAVRPYPTQQQSGGMTATIGAATPPTSGVMDVLRSGFISVRVNGTCLVGQYGGGVYNSAAISHGLV